MGYKKIINKHGREMWYKDGVLISVKDVPQEILTPITSPNASDETKNEETIQTTTPPPEISPAPENESNSAGFGEGCIFGDGGNEFQRLVSLNDKFISIKLCGNCYYTKTLGEIVAYLRRKNES